MPKAPTPEPAPMPAPTQSAALSSAHAVARGAGASERDARREAPPTHATDAAAIDQSGAPTNAPTNAPINAPTSASPGDHAHTGTLARAVRVVSGFTLLSRFAGLARDVLTARMFGDGPLGSAFRAAYLAPNVFRRLFGEGALSAAFLPEYTLLSRDDPQRAGALASIVLWMLTLSTGAITALAILALALRLALWPADDTLALSLRLIILMLPMMPMVCVAAIAGGMLQAHGRFSVPAAAPIVLNLFQIIAGAACFYGSSGSSHGSWVSSTTAAYVVGTAALIASIVTVLWSLHALRGKVSWTRAWESGREPARRVLQRFLPAVLGLGTLQLNTMIDTLVAMWPIWVGPVMFGRATPLDKASNAILSYTQTLYQFPLGVFGIAVATAVFPLLSRSSDKPTEFAEHLRRGARLSLFIALPASLGLWLIRHDLVGVVFGGGGKSFSAEGLVRGAAVLGGFAPAVWVYSLNHVLTRAYYAKGDTRTPMRIAVACVGVNIALNFSLIWSLREAGLAWATATSASVQCVLLHLWLKRRTGATLWDGASRGAVLKTVLATAIMGGCVWGAGALCPAHTSWRMGVVRVCVLVCVGAGAFGAASLLLKLPELRWLMQRGPKGAGADLAIGME